MRKAEEDKKATQNELDDLLMVFGDLEEKVAKYKVSLSLVNSVGQILTFHARPGSTQSAWRDRV